MPSEESFVNFAYGTQEKYDALESKDPDTIYLLEDSKRVYVGEELFSRPVLFGTSEPVDPCTPGSLYVRDCPRSGIEGSTGFVPAHKKLYYNQTGLENGWVLVMSETSGVIRYDVIQVLTSDQKRRARENIGAQPEGDYVTSNDLPRSLYVTLSSVDGRYVPSHTTETIEKSYQLGSSIYCIFEYNGSPVVCSLMRRISSASWAFSSTSHVQENLRVLISIIISDINTEIYVDKVLTPSDLPVSLPCPNKLTFVGGASKEYDGSEPIEVRIPSDSALPAVTAEDDGKTLKVVEGAWTPSEDTSEQAGTADRVVTDHNVSLESHEDIRNLISGLESRLNAVADSDDVTLDQLSEIVAYIKSNKSLIDSITTNKVNVADIVNDLITNVATKPLSAAQGVALKGLIDEVKRLIPGTYTLPVATQTTLGGVKPVSATSAMTQDVGVTSDGRLVTNPSPKEVPAHSHDASTITSGTLPIARGGTGSDQGYVGLKNLLASGDMILSAYQYGDSLPTPGVPGRIFFKKAGS